METITIDAALVSRMFFAGAKRLEANKEQINAMNVFPVPDGDTGTNMTMTILSAAREMDALAQPDMRKLAAAISSGSLKGARGNSGVILSQLLRGFVNVVAEYDTLTLPILSESFARACETAYKAVMYPKEGTILTVASCVAKKAAELSLDSSCDQDTFFTEIIAEAERALARTPELLPVLKEAGVVDAGGQGLVEILKGAYEAFSGKELDLSIAPEQISSGIFRMSEQEDEEITFGYCTEFLILLYHPLTQKQETDYREFLHDIGDSIVLVADSAIVKTHVHTNDPGMVLQKALTFGALSHIKIDNMREEHQEKLIKDAARLAREQAAQIKEVAPAKKKAYGFVAVSMGDGMQEVLEGLGVDCFVQGGQTMNPSTNDILHAVTRVNADTVFLFPNNKNILLAANQAAAMTKEKQVIVIPTTTLPQCISAMINFIPDADVARNTETMKEIIATVKTGQVTYAVRDTSLDGIEIREGDYMGIGEGKIRSAGTDIATVALAMMAQLIDEESSFICIYYGADIDSEEAEALSESLAGAYPQCEVEVQYGGQPVYYYVISVE